MAQAKSISPAELDELIANNSGFRLVDVRSSSEYKEKHIPGAEHFPIDKIESGKFNGEEHEIIITACGSGGGRSERSAKLLADKFQRDVFYLEGGTFGWFRYAELNQGKTETLWKRVLAIGHLPTDNDSEKIKKSILLLMAFPFALAGLGWGVLYFYNGLVLSGWIPFSYGVVSLLSIGHFVIWKKFNFFRFSQILLILLLPFFLQLSLGGFIKSSAVILWSVVSPLGALAFYDVKRSRYWFTGFIILVLIAFVLNGFLSEYIHHNISESFINWLVLMNVLGVSGLIYAMQYYFARRQNELQGAVEVQNAEIAEKNKSITDSINYAKRIQLTLLAHDEFLKRNLNDHFILFQPKDIVSGDFYWATRRGSKFYLAVCDSTGHGVPGAFMSLLNISFLNEAINEKGLQAPNEICNHVRKRLIESISQDGGKDGMDGTLLCIDHESRKLSYAAGNNSPFLVSGNSGRSLGADKMPIGLGEKSAEFNLIDVEIKEGDTLYLFTDGYADQFGGPRGKKFKSKQLQELLVSLSDVSLEEQKKVLDAIITEWKGNLEQTDDILVVGIRV
jgi:serine phosphatase RsbU (regulator of sigma subunit)/rhodanese-related sulfurtransferase